MDYIIQGTIVELTMLQSLKQIAVGLQEGDGRGCNHRLYLPIDQQPYLRLGETMTIACRIVKQPVA